MFSIKVLYLSMYLRVDVGIIMCVVVCWGGKVIFGLFMWEVSIEFKLFVFW